jgi:hypothetical protein
MRKNPRYAAVGVAAGLLGSGATALMLLGPGATSATGTTPTTVAAADDPGDEQTEATESADDNMEIWLDESGSWLREQLEPLVDDGTLTGEQADAVVDQLHDSAPQPRGPGMPDIVVVPGMPGPPDGHWPDWPGGRDGGPHLDHFVLVDGHVVAEAIGIDIATLRAELRGGATAAEVAEVNDVDPQAVIDAIVADAAERLATAVDNGRLTQEEADERLAELTERVTNWVHGETDDAEADGAETDDAEDTTVTTAAA